MKRQLDPSTLGRHFDRLYRAAYALTGSRQDAEDLVQDTFERVLRRPRFLRRDDDIGYLLRALRNTWIRTNRTRRAASVVPLGEEADAIPSRHDDLASKIDSSAVYAALQDLSRPLRETMVAVDLIGLSYQEAARALGTKQGTIMSRVHRGRGQVAARLQLAGVTA